MRSALGGERHAGRGPDKDEACSGVEAVDERIQRARHEGVVEGADREQRLAGELGRKAEMAERPEQVALGDPQLDVLAARRALPGDEARTQRGEAVGRLHRRPHADTIDPATEAGRDGDVRAHGHDPLRDRGRLAREHGEHKTKGLLRRALAGVGATQVLRHLGRRAPRERRRCQRSTSLRAQPAGGGSGREARPLLAGSDTETAAQLDDLFAREEGLMVEGIPDDRQPPPF